MKNFELYFLGGDRVTIEIKDASKINHWMTNKSIVPIEDLIINFKYVICAKRIQNESK